MAKQTMLVSLHEDETRIALTENKLLVGLHVEQTNRERKVGNIYKGTIVKVNPAFQAAFVDYGEDRNGFLSISDVNLELFSKSNGGKKRLPIQSVLKEGMTVMVQVLKEGLKNKGSAMTTFVSLAGRLMVISPNSERAGVSRKIEDPESRQRLKDMLEALQAGENLGVIIRTAGINQPLTELKRDLDALRKTWRGIQERFDKLKKPGLVHQEVSPIVRVLRDYFTADVDEVWVDDPEGFQEALKYFKGAMPKHQKRLQLYVGDKSLFSAHHVEEQIESLDSSQVFLKSGGSLIIESTEALVSVDVNSGRSNKASDIEETALHTNLEAAEEVARQLRLRNLGGLIVIDFIDMVSAKNRLKVETVVADALKDDKARTTVGTISQFGLLELSRQRIDMEISRGLRVQCPTCDGTGHVPTVSASANNVLRKIREMSASGMFSEIHGDLPLENANFLLNSRRESMRDLELEFEIALHLTGNPDLPLGAPIKLHGTKLGGVSQEDVEAMGLDSEQEEESQEDNKRKRRRRRGRSGRDDYDLADSPKGAEAVDDARQPESSDEGEVARKEEDSAAKPGRRARGDKGGRGAERAASASKPKSGRGRERPADSSESDAPKDGATQSGASQTPAAIMFQSAHSETDPEAVEKLPQSQSRPSSFGELADKAEPKTVLFQSAHLGDPPPPKPEAESKASESATEAKTAKAAKGRGRRPSKTPSDSESVTAEENNAASTAASKAKSKAPEKSGKAKDDEEKPPEKTSVRSLANRLAKSLTKGSAGKSPKKAAASKADSAKAAGDSAEASDGGSSAKKAPEKAAKPAKSPGGTKPRAAKASGSKADKAKAS